MSAKEYIQVYNELHDIGLKYSDFVHFLKLCRKGLIYNTCKIKGSRKELAEMIGKSEIEFSKFITRLNNHDKNNDHDNDLVRKYKIKTLDIVDEGYMINPEYVFLGTKKMRDNAVVDFFVVE